MGRDDNWLIAYADAMAAADPNSASPLGPHSSTSPITSGMFAHPRNKGPWDGGVTIDPSCANVPPAHDPGVQTALLNLLWRSQTAQSRNPDGPPYAEYVLSGRPQGRQGYDLSRAYTDGVSNSVDPAKHGLPRPGDTFVAHSHASFNVSPNFSPDDLKSRRPGVADLMIYADGTIRCLPGK